jgi:hypothetical protein
MGELTNEPIYTPRETNNSMKRRIWVALTIVIVVIASFIAISVLRNMINGGDCNPPFSYRVNSNHTVTSAEEAYNILAAQEQTGSKVSDIQYRLEDVDAHAYNSLYGANLTSGKKMLYVLNRMAVDSNGYVLEKMGCI